MNRVTPRVALLLTVPPLLWAGNAIVGRALATSMPPLLLNCIRWWLALAILLPLGWRALGSPERRAQVLARWKPLALLGLLGVGSYNALQYLALQTSTPINVTLIAASTPLWMLLVGAVGYGVKPRAMQGLGAAVSLAGVLVVLSRGQWSQLSAIRLVPGDAWILLAAFAWAVYSWQLAKPPPSMAGSERPDWNWAEFILLQTVFGLVFASAAAAGEAATSTHTMRWTPLLPWALAYVAIGPSILAYRAWGLGVAAAGPSVAAFFSNLTPLFAAVGSAALLGEAPQPYHALAFALIVAGIWTSSRP